MRWEWRYSLRYADRVLRDALPRVIESHAPGLATALRRLPRIASTEGAVKWGRALALATEAHRDEIEAWGAAERGAAWDCYAAARRLAREWRAWALTRVSRRRLAAMDPSARAAHACWCSPAEFVERVAACDPDVRWLSREEIALRRASAG